LSQTDLDLEVHKKLASKYEITSEIRPRKINKTLSLTYDAAQKHLAASEALNSHRESSSSIFYAGRFSKRRDHDDFKKKGSASSRIIENQQVREAAAAY
jgi:fructose-1-phosphate kinase PfkB-like protein